MKKGEEEQPMSEEIVFLMINQTSETLKYKLTLATI